MVRDDQHVHTWKWPGSHKERTERMIQINWPNCCRLISTIQDRVRERRNYTDHEHKMLDAGANSQLQEGYWKRKGMRGKDIGYVKRGVYYPGKDLDIRDTHIPQKRAEGCEDL